MDGRGRTVMVTGAADGLGLAIASRFAELGDRVALLDIDGERLAASVRRLRTAGHEVDGFPADVSDEAGVGDAVAAAAERFGPVRVAVSNAGIAPNAPVLDCSKQRWDRVIDVNLTGTFLFTRAVGRAMVDVGAGGAICCVSSGAHRLGRVGAAAYCASKAGIVMYAKVLAMELGAHGIRVNVVAPGFIDHGYREGLGDFVSGDYAEAMAAATPLNRRGAATDVAGAVEYLCSDAGGYVSGAVLAVDGASSAGRFHIPWSGTDNV